ncbi:MAG: glycerophosphodiester phosphodiesterase family protein [Sphingobacteriaceae bacterium]|jgi:glycerophosphoryl diester phosphodiesterase|nr:glycerophosphodiester phosphodiesterase family protein [Sphingobacteriaceae bacterium]
MKYLILFLSFTISLNARPASFKNPNKAKAYNYIISDSSGKSGEKSVPGKVRFSNPEAMREFFRYAPDRKPLVFAHRGGTSAGYPENCIATFQHTLETVTPFFETDPHLTKDSVIVLLHDGVLDRTTTGKGKLSDYTWEEVKKLRLKDPEGNVTNYRIPTLEEALRWSKGKAVFMLDKKDVPLAMLADRIKKLNATSRVIISAYTLEEAKYHYSQNPDIMLEAFLKNEKEFAEYQSSGIPWENLFAYVSQPKEKKFYDLLHANGVMAMVYTATVIEKQPVEKRLQDYKRAIEGGADLLLSDRVKEVAEVVYNLRTNK